MEKAEWIWVDNNTRDLHAEFICPFDCQSLGEPVGINLSCDGNYAVTLNGQLVGLGQMSDFENYKLCDTYALNSRIKVGKNLLCVQVWHIGVDSVNYRAERPGVWFEVVRGGSVIARSCRQTQSRLIAGYEPDYRRMIAQVGITSLYDFRRKSGEFCDSVLSPKRVNFAVENVQNLNLLPEVTGKIIAKEDNRLLVDLGCEYYGFINFKLRSHTGGNRFSVFFGEHILPEGTVLRDLGVCHFGLDFVAEEGINEYRDHFRPVGCRYLEIVAERPVEAEYLGIIPLSYGFCEKKFELNDKLDRQIYQTCVRTLVRCANKHYIDCPWREQGMYVLDSRNQMLCGYYAFGEYALPRFNIIFLSKGMTEYGLLSSCPPSPQKDFIIPFFSLVYVIQTYEYVIYSGDKSVIGEVEGALSEIMGTFIKRIDGNRLIPRFPRENFWNFYEWTQGSDGCACEEESNNAEVYDLILNCAFVLATEKYGELLKMTGKEFDFPIDEYRKTVRQTFYDGGNNLFRLNTRTREYSKLGCSLAILAEIVTGEEAKAVAKKAVDSQSIADCSLACAGFYYDALLKVSADYKNFILNDIRKKYKYMLDNGATTFWETLNGSAENGGIGSLCHGWSALPVYYYHKFFADKGQ